MRRGALVVAALVVLGCSGWPSDLTQACWLDDDQCASMAAKEVAADGPLRDEAMEQLDRLCMQDHPAGCYEAGMVRGFGKTPSRARAAVDLHKACEVSYGEACFQEARVLDGSGEGQDYGRAAAIYATECDKGSAGSCTNLGYMVERGHGGAVDVPKAATLYGKGCDGGDQVGCVNFGLMLAKGTGIEQDAARARQVFGKACDAGHLGGCFQLGRVLRGDQGGPPDEVRAEALVKKACDGGYLDACDLVALFLLNRGEVQEGMAVLTKACDADDGASCNRIGVVVDNGQFGVPVDKARAKALFQRSCALGEGRACMNVTFHVPPEEESTWMERACDLALADGCNDWAKAVETAGDQAKARSLYARACDYGSALGCHNAGILFEREPADPPAALGYYERACAGGREAACPSALRLSR